MRSARYAMHMYSEGPPLMLYQTTEDVKVKTRTGALCGYCYPEIDVP